MKFSFHKMRLKLKINLLIAAAAILAMTTLQAQAHSSDFAQVAVGGVLQHIDYGNTGGPHWLDFANFFDTTSAFIVITGALNGYDDTLASASETDLLPRSIPVISGLRG